VTMSFWLSYVVLWLISGLSLVLALVLLNQLGHAYLGTVKGINRDGLPIGSRAPNLNVLTPSGHVRALLEGDSRPLLAIFGAPSCGPCQRLLPNLEVFAASKPPLRVVFLSSGDQGENLELQQQHALRVVEVLGISPDAVTAYQVRVSPFGFLVDQNGTIQAKGLASDENALNQIVEFGMTRWRQSQPVIAARFS
jgi:methylamine dehydrogenase accessory protein MauD